jgi:hypothetical protein
MGGLEKPDPELGSWVGFAAWANLAIIFFIRII